MNVRLSFLLVAVLIIFGGTFLVFQFTRAEDSPPDPPWLYKVDDSSIVHIEATYNGQTVNYDKKPGSTTWYIQEEGRETPVFLDKWSGTPLLLSGPRVNRVLSQTIDNPEAYGLDPPKSSIKVTERSGRSYEFHMGDPTPDGNNQYAYLVGDPQLFTVPQIWAEVINRLVTEPPYPRPYYIDKDNSIAHIGVNYNGKAVDYQKQLGSQEWVVLGDSETPVAQEQWQQILPLLTMRSIWAEASPDLGAGNYQPGALRSLPGGGHARRPASLRPETGRTEALCSAGKLGQNAGGSGQRPTLFLRTTGRVPRRGLLAAEQLFQNVTPSPSAVLRIDSARGLKSRCTGL
jgi:hypothetical protein